MKKRLLWIAGAALAVAAMVSLRTSRAQEELDPLKVASDTHKLLFENRFVRIIGAQVPPGKIEPKHRHPHGVSVFLADYDIEQRTFPGGRLSKAHRAFGTVIWNEAVVHEVKNVGKTASNVIRIELKN